MIDYVKQELTKKVLDQGLIENLFQSYFEISREHCTQDPVGILQNTGLFVESALRVIEHFIFNSHTPLSQKLDIGLLLENIEKSQGPEGLRIHAGRLCRAAYDFRSRKKSVHLKSIDPELIDGSLVYNITTWILIEILKTLNINKNVDDVISILFTRHVPLVQKIEDITRTTNPKLNGAQRILLLLYASPDGLIEEELLKGTKIKNKNMKHLLTNLNNLYDGDLVHKKNNGKWILFGMGPVKVEEIIRKFSKPE